MKHRTAVMSLLAVAVGLFVARGAEAVGATQAGGTTRPSAAGAGAEAEFERPFRLEADGAVIDTGAAWGHSSPCAADLNGDGVKDLLLGDFGGKFRIYLNAGTAAAPRYEAGELLQAGGVDAEVRIYCCIGSQARVHDLDGDGIFDLLANSYDPGNAYLFRGLPGNAFAAREELLDKAGVPLRSAPVQKQNHQSFGSFFDAVDWDADGDLDVLVGCFSGELKLRINEGTAQRMSFAAENVAVEADGAPLKVDAHCCPVIADWDADGQWDIIAGSDDGSVTFFRNVGRPGKPAFAAGRTLVKKHEGGGNNGYNLVLWNKVDVAPGIRAQPEVTDYNGDGKLDLLVGDFYTAFDFKPDITDEQKRQAKELIAVSRAGSEPFVARMKAMREDFAKRYPGEEINSDKANEEWSAAYQALRESPESKRMEEQDKEFSQKLRPFLASTHGDGDRSFDLAKPHGHVWVFVRK